MLVEFRPRRTKANFWVLILLGLFLLLGWQAFAFLQPDRHPYAAASRLPAELVSECQKAASSEIPWYYLAAYFLVDHEENDIPFPGAEGIKKLAADLNATEGANAVKKIKHARGRAFAKSVRRRAKQISAAEGLFSPCYLFPVQCDGAWFEDTWLAPRDGGERQHLGTDIFAPEGTPLLACTDGIIENAGWLKLGGNRIGLRGTDGIYYYYAHLCNYAPGITAGKKVEKGEVIGYVGHTGNAINTPNHLHFGMQTRWKTWVNPYNFLKYWELRARAP